MRQAFENQLESKPVSYLCQQVRNNDRFASACHTEQDAVLMSVSEPRFDSDKIPSRRHCLVANSANWYGNLKMNVRRSGVSDARSSE